MKAQAGSHGWVYLRINSTQDFVMSHGLEFKEFYFALSDRLPHLLLLKHQFDNASFNMHTYLEYVEREDLLELAMDQVSSYGEFCWIDFEDEAGVNEMTGQEIAELLYISHMKTHLRMPFYRKLNNRYVYLSADDGQLNRTYYREWNDFYAMLGYVMPLKWNAHNSSKGFIKLKKSQPLPPISKDTMMTIAPLLREGIVMSVEHAVNGRNKVEIPVWAVGDYNEMDELEDELKFTTKQEPAAWFTFDRKTKDWVAAFA